MSDILAANAKKIDAIWGKLAQKMPFSCEKANHLDFIPYSVKNGEWIPGGEGIHWWTNGFWPAAMWQMYLGTGDTAYRAEAERAEEMLDAAFHTPSGLHHDVGFMWLISSGVHYRLTKNQKSYERLLLAANLLAGRFNPNGFIRAWNGDKTGWAIIDCMMNIPLLYVASVLTSDPRYGLIARKHADTTLAHFVREDGSVHHIVAFDPETGAVCDTPCGQGFAPGSSWSRGQAWAMYGFLLSYLHTGELRYLNASKRIAHYFIVNTAEDWIPLCDFRATEEPVIKDMCAGAIAACALIGLSRVVDRFEGHRYSEAAWSILEALDAQADWSRESPGILPKCTSAYHNGEHHIYMNYADYFFIEAIRTLKDENALSFFGTWDV